MLKWFTKRKTRPTYPKGTEVPVFCDTPRDEALRRAKHNAEVRRLLALRAMLCEARR